MRKLFYDNTSTQIYFPKQQSQLALKRSYREQGMHGDEEPLSNFLGSVVSQLSSKLSKKHSSLVSSLGARCLYSHKNIGT